ncbi:MAG: hypothetical protein LBD01_01845, partial [Puniceicoccales bacterium]|nr:hypothetical protein [Puniceicoccales bacterium]
GNTSELIKSTGGVSAHYQYDPFGREILSSGPQASLNIYRFSTKPFDATSGLSYYGFRFYAVGFGRWTSRDPIEEADSENLYLFNTIIQGIDILGLASDGGASGKKTNCKGKCGAIADDWIMEELESQQKGWSDYLKQNPKHRNDINRYLRWANGNQRYKDSSYFKFNSETSCGTQPDEKQPGCGMSITLCSHCVKSSILGNIVYGFMGAMAGFSEGNVVDEANKIKGNWGWLPGATYDPYDEKAYRLGYALGSRWKDMSKRGFCAVFNESLKEFPEALYEGNKNGGYNDPSTCEPCDEKTKEKRHGGSETPRRRP